MGLFILVYLVPVEMFAERHPLHSDFIVFYKSISFFWQEADIYQPVAFKEFSPFSEGLKIERIHLHLNLNPPLQTVLMSPLGLLSYSQAFAAWWLFSFSCGIGAALLLWLDKGTKTPAALLNMLLLLLAYYPTLLNLFIAQFGLILLLLCSAGWVALRRSHDRLAGLALGLAFSLKLFPGFFVILLVAQRRWRALAWFIGIFIACGIFAGLIAGFDSYRGYLGALREIKVSWYNPIWNASAMGFLSRIFGGTEDMPLADLPRLAHVLHYSLGAALVLANFWLARRDKTSPERLDLAFALSIVSMLLLSPSAWAYYFPLLLLPFLILWRRLGALQLGRNPRALLIFVWFLSTVPNALIPSGTITMNNPIIWFFWNGFYFYTLLLLVVLLINVGVKSR
jgi:hypothetical protein